MPTHFQTCLYIRPSDIQQREGWDVLREVQEEVLGWIRSKESTDDLNSVHENLRGIRRTFCRMTKTTKVGKGSTVKTEVYQDGGLTGCAAVQAWAVRYRHQDSGFKDNRRKWCVDIGIRRLDAAVCVCQITVSHEQDKYYLGDVTQESAPAPSTPRVVSALIHNPNLEIALDRDFFLNVQHELIIATTPKSLDVLFNSLLGSHLRRYVAIVAYGEQVRAAAEGLHRALQGKAMVAYIDDSLAMRDAMRAMLIDSELRIPYNSVRVIFPRSSISMAKVNRYFTRDNIGFAHESIVRNLLANHMLFCRDAVGDVEAVANMVKLHKSCHAALLEAAEKQQDVNKDQVITQLQAELHEAWNLCVEEEYKHKEAMAEQQRELERCADLLERKDKALRRLEREQQPDRPAELPFPDTFELPTTLTEVLQTYGTWYPDRLVVTHQALQSAKDCDAANDRKMVDIAWKMLAALAKNLYGMKFAVGGPAFDDKAFKHETGFGLAMTEGRMTKRDSTFQRSRTLTYGGKAYDFTPHIKSGTRPPKCLRLHFAFMEEERKILVCHLGDHLENRTSMGIK